LQKTGKEDDAAAGFVRLSSFPKQSVAIICKFCRYLQIVASPSVWYLRLGMARF
jgi:membrane protein YqaA with SNARE-associated domain